ncbi:MAG: hypothetical protein PWQ84_1604 [Thermotogaceae bacterium]|nr:hypothetical protein [Thermotogaceae bacterium]
MRIAVMIISIVLIVFIGFQSCALSFFGGFIDEETQESGSSGIIVALLFAFVAAFALKFPKVSMVFCVLIALISFSIASGGIYEDMYVWGTISIILAVMSLFGSREFKKKTEK